MSAFTLRPPGELAPLPLSAPNTGTNIAAAATAAADTPSNSSQLLAGTPPASVPHMSRLVKNNRGRFMFIGDSATLSFLQNIRRIVRRWLSDCSFVMDPLRHLTVEATPEGRSRGWIVSSAENPPPRQSASEVEYLKQWYKQSVNCVLLLFDEQELDKGINDWLQQHEQRQVGDKADPNPVSSVYYLVFAIGAQTGPEDREDLAEVFFNYGRYMTVETLMEDPDIPTIQAFALITMYLLNASRRNSAFMYLGMAVRAAYALGLHRKDISSMYPPAECQVRERAWKAIRILDLFMSASLGRPPSTAETRDTTSREDYSACNDLSKIFESVLSDVYAKRAISTEVLERISKDHRRWAAQSSEGLERDGIQRDRGNEVMLRNGQPNMGLLHLKQTAYWTIILLSLPFLLKAVSLHVDTTLSSLPPGQERDSTSFSSSNQALVFACLESAIDSIDLLEPVFATDHVPKRLPFVMNSVFISGLVLGAAIFGDLDANFPLERSLRLARCALRRFSRYDAVARRHSVILEHLQDACEKYVEIRTRRKMERQGHFVKGLFGPINHIGMTMRKMRDQQDEFIPPLVTNHVSHHSSFDTAAQVTGATDGHGGNRLQNIVGEDGEEQEANDPGQRGTDGHPNSYPGGEELPNFVPAISPSMLWFDSLGDTLPLFPIVDAHMMGKDMDDLGFHDDSFLR
jgi:hypothetical protein